MYFSYTFNKSYCYVGQFLDDNQVIDVSNTEDESEKHIPSSVKLTLNLQSSPESL